MYHKTPLSSSDLSDDGSPEYKNLKSIYNVLFEDDDVQDYQNYIDI
jgi:hypothetical protein